MAYTTIDDPSAYFQANLHSGDGGTGQTLTFNGNSDLQLNFHWGKCRSESGRDWQVIDTVRGITKGLTTTTSAAEYTNSTYVTAIGSNGYSIGQNNDNNKAGETYVSYNWKAGTSFTNDASSTGVGSIDSAGSVNTDAGFSIVSYTGNGSAGATVAHGLGSAANLLIVKKRSSTAQWVFGSTALDSSWDNFLFLDATSAKGNADNVFNDTAPTSSVFSIGNAGDTNASSQTYICYAFAEKKGYSKFGSYTGNGNADGTFVYTGFKPAWIMIKRTDGASEWSIYDTTRKTFNVGDLRLEPNSSSAEDSHAVNYHDILSNGFKMRNSDAARNGSGNNYIFMAFAENPFVTSTGIPATAR